MGQRRVDAITGGAIGGGAVALIVIFIGIHIMGTYFEGTGEAIIEAGAGRQMAGPAAVLLFIAGLVMLSKRYWLSGLVTLAAACVFVWASYFTLGVSGMLVTRVRTWSLLFYPALLIIVPLEIAFKRQR